MVYLLLNYLPGIAFLDEHLQTKQFGPRSGHFSLSVLN